LGGPPRKKKSEGTAGIERGGAMVGSSLCSALHRRKRLSSRHQNSCGVLVCRQGRHCLPALPHFLQLMGKSRNSFRTFAMVTSTIYPFYMKLFSTLLFALALTLSVNAQTRYLDQVFSDVTVDTSVVYGVNATVLFFQVFGAIQEPQFMDVYRPSGDTASSRPLVLFFHTGNFLPFNNPSTGAPFFAGSCGGTRRDSSVVEMCTRLAKMGYVVASCTYRKGWDPTATDELVRRDGLINAAYRGVQDARMAVRYFRKSFSESSNAWGIDTSKIVLWGQGTGGYISLNATSLDAYIKIPTASNNKFMKPHPTEPGVFIPMVIEAVNGNIDGTSFGVLPGNTDTLNYPQHVGYSSNFKLAVNMAGAMADSSWVDPGQPAIISFHTPTDIFAPYDQGIVVVPGVNFNVVEVQGSHIVGGMADNFNNNNAFNGVTFLDPLYTNKDFAYANSPTTPVDVTAPRSGLYPFLVSNPANTAPWEWTFTTAGPLNCNTDKSIALPYIDTIMTFYAPRACLVLELSDCVTKIVSSKDLLNADQVGLQLMPNPASDMVRVTTNATETMRHIRLIDMQGRVVASQVDINSSDTRIMRGDLPAGKYLAQVFFDKGHLTVQVIFE